MRTKLNGRKRGSKAPKKKSSERKIPNTVRCALLVEWISTRLKMTKRGGGGELRAGVEKKIDEWRN